MRKVILAKQRSDGVLFRRDEEIREVWMTHFESMMIESMGGRAKVINMEVKIKVGKPYPQGRWRDERYWMQ